MKRYLISRLIQAIFVVFGVSIVVFLVLRLSGDPVTLMLPPDASQEEIELMRERMGFNDPVAVQYYRFLTGALVGDFGTSLRFSNQPALDLVLSHIPATFQLAFSSILFAVLLGVPLGMLAAIRKNSFIDFLARLIALLGQAIPSFWLGLMLILVFSVSLSLLPSSGNGGFLHLIMPVITVGAFSASAITRISRSSMLEVLNKDYIRTAKAKGLANKIIWFNHALRNAMLPIITVIGMEMGGLLGGAVITETVFAWPGIGRLAVEAINARDYPLVQAIVFISAIVFVVINLLIDLIYSMIDPRIRYGR